MEELLTMEEKMERRTAWMKIRNNSQGIESIIRTIREKGFDLNNY